MKHFTVNAEVTLDREALEVLPGALGAGIRLGITAAQSSAISVHCIRGLCCLEHEIYFAASEVYKYISISICISK